MRSVTRANRVVMSRLAYLLCDGSLLRNYPLPPFCDGPIHFACPAKPYLCAHRQQFRFIDKYGSDEISQLGIRSICQHGTCSDDHRCHLWMCAPKPLNPTKQHITTAICDSDGGARLARFAFFSSHAWKQTCIRSSIFLLLWFSVVDSVLEKSFSHGFTSR